MAKLHFWQDKIEVFDNEGSTMQLKWLCSDGVSTHFGDTKAEAASHFGVPVGNFDDDIKTAAAALGRKGGQARSEKKTLANRAKAKLPRPGRKGGKEE